MRIWQIVLAFFVIHALAFGSFANQPPPSKPAEPPSPTPPAPAPRPDHPDYDQLFSQAHQPNLDELRRNEQWKCEMRVGMKWGIDRQQIVSFQALDSNIAAFTVWQATSTPMVAPLFKYNAGHELMGEHSGSLSLDELYSFTQMLRMTDKGSLLIKMFERLDGYFVGQVNGWAMCAPYHKDSNS